MNGRKVVDSRDTFWVEFEVFQPTWVSIHSNSPVKACILVNKDWQNGTRKLEHFFCSALNPVLIPTGKWIATAHYLQIMNGNPFDQGPCWAWNLRLVLSECAYYIDTLNAWSAYEYSDYAALKPRAEDWESPFSSQLWCIPNVPGLSQIYVKGSHVLGDGSGARDVSLWAWLGTNTNSSGQGVYAGGSVKEDEVIGTENDNFVLESTGDISPYLWFLALTKGGGDSFGTVSEQVVAQYSLIRS